MRRPSSRLTCSHTEVALFLMLGMALQRLAPQDRKIHVSEYDIRMLISGKAPPRFRIGFSIDDKKYKRIWRTIWGPAHVPNLKYELKPEKTRVFNL